MRDALLTPDPTYDPQTQPVIAAFAASLDDQTEHLRRLVAELPVETLEWQATPGENTIGMLLAHIPIAEAWWMLAAAQGVTARQDADDVLIEAIGIRMADDGMPVPDGGGHPETLRGQTAAEYLGRIDAARIRTHGVLHEWSDASLAETFEVQGRTKSRRWTLYHVLEHLSSHLGQIRVLKRQAAGRPAP
ncbi:MAG: DinB family protein [Planctomycetota bacterium]|nr:DinB family protein [Planctomycetota bacterium]